MKKSILMVCFSTFIWAETITTSPIDIQETNLTSGTVILSEEEAKETSSVTLQERLAQDISFSTLVGGNVEKTISFRGVNFKATEYVEDGIPLYRNVSGFTDPKFTMTSATLQTQ